MSTNVLEVKNLTKKFGSFTAVDNLSLSMADGEILGLLGPNGAGKTSTIQMLLGVLTPTNGTISYFGKNFTTHREEILEQVNFSSTYTNLPWNLTVKENLTFISYLYSIQNRAERVEKVIKTFKLEKLVNQTMNKLSAVQLTRINLAKAFLNYPKVLLLDEPTASLDPDVASYIREFLLNERENFNVSIILTSHNMSEVEEVCDRVIFINEGKIVANDTPDHLAKTIEIAHVELLIEEGKDGIEKYSKEEGIPYKKEERTIIFDIKEKEIAKFLREITDRGVIYNEISIQKPTLEDYFLQ